MIGVIGRICNHSASAAAGRKAQRHEAGRYIFDGSRNFSAIVPTSVIRLHIDGGDWIEHTHHPSILQFRVEVYVLRLPIARHALQLFGQPPLPTLCQILSFPSSSITMHHDQTRKAATAVFFAPRCCQLVSSYHRTITILVGEYSSTQA